MIIFNWVAVAMALPGFLLFYLLATYVPGGRMFGVVLFLGLTGGIDLFMRHRGDPEATLTRRLLVPWRGGHVFFVPLWISGAFLLLLMAFVFVMTQFVDKAP